MTKDMPSIEEIRCDHWFLLDPQINILWRMQVKILTGMKGQIELIIFTIQITNEYWEINIEIMDEDDEDSWKSVIDSGPFSIETKPNPQETRIKVAMRGLRRLFARISVKIPLTVRYETHFRILSAQVCDIPFRTPQDIPSSNLCLVKSYNSIRRSKIFKKRLSNPILIWKIINFVN